MPRADVAAADARGTPQSPTVQPLGPSTLDAPFEQFCFSQP